MGVLRAPDRQIAPPSPTPASTGNRLLGSRYGAAEVIGAVTVVSIALATLSELIPTAAGIALALSVPPTVVDVHERRLPDVWIATALIGLTTALAVNAASGGSVDLRNVAAGALAMSVPILVLHLASPSAMGFGDVKLSIVLGGALGTVDWRLAMVALCTAGLLGATYGLATRRRTVPFGPFLVTGALLALFASGSILIAFVDAGASA